MNFLPIFFQHYFVLVIALAVFYFIGHFLFFILRNYFTLHGFYLDYFSKTLLGIVAFVAIYSMIITHVKTVNLCFFLIFALIFYELKKYSPPALPVNKKENNFKLSIVFELLIIAFFMCGWEALFLLQDNVFPFVTPHFDHTDYSTISQFLNLTGQENAFRESNLYDGSFHGLIPYHYFELWLNAALAGCSGLLYSGSLLLVVYPLFYFLFYLAINSLWEEFGEITFSKKIFSILFLFFGAFCFPFYEKLPFVNSYFYGLVIKSYPVEFLAKKMICIYIFIIPAFMLIRRNYFSTGFLFLLCLPVIFASTAPGIIIGGFFFIAVAYLLKLFPVKELNRTLLYLLAFSLFIFSLYKISGNTSFVTVEGNIFDLMSTGNPEIKKQRADIIWLCQTIPFQVILAYVPFIIIVSIFFFSKKTRGEISDLRSIILLTAAIIFTGFLTWMVLLPVTDSFQFYSSTITLLNAGCILILTKLFSLPGIRSVSQLKKTIACAFLFAALILQIIFSFNQQWKQKLETENLYSSNYILEIEKVKSEIKNPVGACFYSSETPMLAPYRIQIGLYLKFIPGFQNLVNISLLDKDYANPREKHHLKSSLFYQYVMKQKTHGDFKSINQSQSDFIKEFKIDYIVAQKNSLISVLVLQRVKKVITDPQSGEKFILLN